MNDGCRVMSPCDAVSRRAVWACCHHSIHYLLQPGEENFNSIPTSLMRDYFMLTLRAYFASLKSTLKTRLDVEQGSVWNDMGSGWSRQEEATGSRKGGQEAAGTFQLEGVGWKGLRHEILGSLHPATRGWVRLTRKYCRREQCSHYRAK